MAIEVWWSDLTAAGTAVLALLDDTERARVESLDRPADRGRSLLGAALVRVAVGTCLGVAPESVRVDRTCAECGGPHGAPRIVGPGSTLPWVSVSHSGLLVVVALDLDGPIGVDVQRVADLPDPATASDWVGREAVLKAHTFSPDAELAVRELWTPLPGHLAALAAPTGATAACVVRRWPPGVSAG